LDTMIKTIKTIISINVILITLIGYSQETVNGSDLNSFIIGGGQQFTDASLFVNAVSLVDVSPQGVAVIADGSSALLEAGIAALAGGTTDFIPDIWLNYTYRPINPGNVSEIFIRTSHPMPAGISLRARVIETSVGGNFIDRGINNNISINENNQRIVRSFGAGYTDDGETNGYKIQYTFSNTGGEELPPGFSIIYEIIKR
jgi:hypothetical protein